MLFIKRESSESAEDFGVPVSGAGGWVPGEKIEGTGLAAGSVVVDQCVTRIFVAAYLLTGCARQAEAVTLESIRQLDVRATRKGQLSWKVITAAVTRGRADSGQPRDTSSTDLPVELQRVLRLPTGLRQSFVLRVLMAMPRLYCAEILRIPVAQVDSNASLAARELARIVTSEVAGGRPRVAVAIG